MNLFFRQRSNIGTYFMLILEPCKEDAEIGGSSMLLVPLVPNFGFGILRLETEDSRNWMDIKFEYTKREGKTIIDLHNWESEGFSISREYVLYVACNYKLIFFYP